MMPGVRLGVLVGGMTYGSKIITLTGVTIEGTREYITNGIS
jgi:hypothetical protein